jgi:hypothetical protein
MNKINKFLLSRGVKSVVAAGLMVGFSAANAAIDTGSVTTELTSAAAAVAVVGAAVLVVKVGTRVFKWVASAL